MADSTADASEQRLGADDVQAIDRLRELYARLRTELARVIVGQDEVIERLSICLFARGHALLMGVPGLAKTLLVSKLEQRVTVVGKPFKLEAPFMVLATQNPVEQEGT